MVARAKIRSSYAVDDPVDSKPSVSTKSSGRVSSDFQSHIPFVWVCRVCPTPNPVEHGTASGRGTVRDGRRKREYPSDVPSMIWLRVKDLPVR